MTEPAIQVDGLSYSYGDLDSRVGLDGAVLANPFTPVTPDNQGAVEDAAWALCQNGATRVPCDDYLSGWPQGRYGGLARTRIRDLHIEALMLQQGGR